MLCTFYNRLVFIQIYADQCIYKCGWSVEVRAISDNFAVFVWGGEGGGVYTRYLLQALWGSFLAWFGSYLCLNSAWTSEKVRYIEFQNRLIWEIFGKSKQLHWCTCRWLCGYCGSQKCLVTKMASGQGELCFQDSNHTFCILTDLWLHHTFVVTFISVRFVNFLHTLPHFETHRGPCFWR